MNIRKLNGYQSIESAQPMPLKNIAPCNGIQAVLDSGFHAVDSRFQV